MVVPLSRTTVLLKCQDIGDDPAVKFATNGQTAGRSEQLQRCKAHASFAIGVAVAKAGCVKVHRLIDNALVEKIPHLLLNLGLSGRLPDQYYFADLALGYLGVR